MTTLESVEYVDTFRKLKLKHDQEKDRQENKPEMATYVLCLPLCSLSTSLPPPPPPPPPCSKIGILHADTGRFRRDPRQLDEDEEAWFDDEEEVDTSVPVLTVAEFAKIIGPLQTIPSSTSLSSTVPQAVPSQVKMSAPSPGSPLPSLTSSSPPLFLTSSSYSPRPNAPIKRAAPRSTYLQHTSSATPSAPVFRSVSSTIA